MYTLSDQLLELRNNILRDRSDIIAGDSDQLWTDETLIRYIGDAENRFCRRTMILRDSTTPEVCRVKLKQGQKLYKLHDSILALLSAKFGAAENDLSISGHSIVTGHVPNTYLNFNPTAPYTIAPGTPVAVFTDEAEVYDRRAAVTLTTYPVPSATEDGQYINIRVVRKPLTKYSVNDLDRCSEVPDDYQLDVLEGAAWLAQRTWDSDAGSSTTADKHKANFEEAITRTLREMKRRAFVPMGFSYGQNGFSWER
jgi:hypothetical protein